MHALERAGWLVAALLLAALAIPWFLWGDDAVLAGLPVWLWWHVAWMLLASAAFRLFAGRAWGLGIEPGFDDHGPASDSVTDGSGTPAPAGTRDDRGDRTGSGGERR